MKIKNCLTFCVFFLFSCGSESVNIHVVNNQGSTVATEYMADKFYKEKRYSEAKQFYDTLVLRDSTKGEYYARRAYCSARLGNLESAKNDYLKTVNLAYDDKKTIYLSLGLIYKFYRQYDSAIYFYDECLKLDSTFIKAKTEKAEVNSLRQISK